VEGDSQCDKSNGRATIIIITDQRKVTEIAFGNWGHLHCGQRNGAALKESVRGSCLRRLAKKRNMLSYRRCEFDSYRALPRPPVVPLGGLEDENALNLERGNIWRRSTNAASEGRSTLERYNEGNKTPGVWDECALPYAVVLHDSRPISE